MTEDAGPLFAWRPRAADILPFPANRRVGYVRRNAAHAATFKRAEAVERYLGGLVDMARERLLKAGVDHEIAEADAAALERVLWSEFRRVTSRKGGHGGHGGAA